DAKKDVSDFSTGLPDRAARLLHRKAARGDPLIGAVGRRRPDYLHPADIDVEFVGGDLGQRGDDALADLYLARRERQMPFGREPDPRRQFWVCRKIDRQFWRRGGGRGGAHGVAISAAARSTARTMRLCEPQRHKLRSSAPLTSASDGFGFCFNSAAALIKRSEERR